MIKEMIIKDIKQCWKKLGYKYNENYFVETPKVKEHGDYSTNAALVNAKRNKLKSIEMAEKIAAMLSRKRHYSSVEVAGNGFINFKISKNHYQKMIKQVFNAGLSFGSSNYGANKRVVIEFVSANPTGPLNVVNARAAAFGDVLSRVMNYIGFNAKREFYVNDAGNQVDVLAESLELRYREVLGYRVEEFPEGMYQGEYVREIAQRLKSKEGSKFVHYSEVDRLERLKEFAIQDIQNMQQLSLEAYGVEFDSWVSEKMLRTQGAIEEALSYLVEANCTYESDGAVWFASSKFGDEKDRVLMKSDGEITYLVPDIAYHITKYERNFDIMIDVLGPDHHGYIPRLKAALEAISLDTGKLEVIFLQQVNLFEDGERVKMSKRTGHIITMDELVEEVGIDASRYFFIEKKPNTHLNFDLDLAKKKTSENPVFYCQYAHARICSIIRKARGLGIKLKDIKEGDPGRLRLDEEIEMMNKILSFPEVLQAVADNREPHRLAHYTHDLAALFHKYYQSCQILRKQFIDLTVSRLYLLLVIRNILAISFSLMGISAPERMYRRKSKVQPVQKTTTVKQ